MISLISLEPFTQKDYKRFINWIPSEEFMLQFAGSASQFPVTEEQLETFYNSNIRHAFRIKEIQTDQIIGHCEINNIDSITGKARLSRLLIAQTNQRNKGYGTTLLS